MEVFSPAYVRYVLDSLTHRYAIVSARGEPNNGIHTFMKASRKCKTVKPYEVERSLRAWGLTK